jgi:hypothetical protein
MDEGWIGGCAAQAGFRGFRSGRSYLVNRGAIADEGNDPLPFPGPRQSSKPYVPHANARPGNDQQLGIMRRLG